MKVNLNALLSVSCVNNMGTGVCKVKLYILDTYFGKIYNLADHLTNNKMLSLSACPFMKGDISNKK